MTYFSLLRFLAHMDSMHLHEAFQKRLTEKPVLVCLAVQTALPALILLEIRNLDEATVEIDIGARCMWIMMLQEVGSAVHVFSL